MPKQRGVSGFWLDIKALENDRTHLVGEFGPKEGLLIYGLWVRLFTWQYKTAQPIKGYRHVARLTGLNVRTAQRLMQSLVQSLPQSLVQRSGQWYCKRTMQVLGNYNENQELAGATSDPKTLRDSDSYSYSSSDSSVLLSSEVKQPLESTPKEGGLGGVQAAPAPPTAPATLVGLNQQAWEDYQEHRRSIRVRPLKPKSVDRLQRWLVDQGDIKTQAAIIDQTIRNGWTGLFELKGAAGKGTIRTGAVSAEQFDRWLNDEDGETYEGEYHEVH